MLKMSDLEVIYNTYKETNFKDEVSVYDIFMTHCNDDIFRIIEYYAVIGLYEYTQGILGSRKDIHKKFNNTKERLNLMYGRHNGKSYSRILNLFEYMIYIKMNEIYHQLTGSYILHTI